VTGSRDNQVISILESNIETAEGFEIRAVTTYETGPKAEP